MPISKARPPSLRSPLTRSQKDRRSREQKAKAEAGTLIPTSPCRPAGRTDECSEGRRPAQARESDGHLQGPLASVSSPLTLCRSARRLSLRRCGVRGRLSKLTSSRSPSSCSSTPRASTRRTLATASTSEQALRRRSVSASSAPARGRGIRADRQRLAVLRQALVARGLATVPRQPSLCTTVH